MIAGNVVCHSCFRPEMLPTASVNSDAGAPNVSSDVGVLPSLPSGTVPSDGAAVADQDNFDLQTEGGFEPKKSTVKLKLEVLVEEPHEQSVISDASSLEPLLAQPSSERCEFTGDRNFDII